MELNPHCDCFPIVFVSNTPIVNLTPLHIWTFSSAVRCTTTARLLSAGGWTSSVVKPTVANQIQWRKGCMEGGIGFTWFYIPWLSTHCLRLVSPPSQQTISTWWGCATQEALRALAETPPWDPWYHRVIGDGWRSYGTGKTWRGNLGLLVRGPYHQYASGIWGTELLHALTYHTHTHIYIIDPYIQLDDIWCSLINSKHIFWGSYGDLIAFGLLVSIAQSLMQLRCGSLCLSIPASALGSAWQCP